MIEGEHDGSFGENGHTYQVTVASMRKHLLTSTVVTSIGFYIRSDLLIVPAQSKEDVPEGLPLVR